MSPGESVRSKFTGNTCFYVHNARFRNRIFLNRNFETVLRENEAAQARGGNPAPSVPGNSTPPTTDADARISNGFRVRPRMRINQIISKLRPPIPTGRDEPVLKIEVKALKRKRLFKPRSNGENSAINGNEVHRNYRASGADGSISFRCKCELTIYERLENQTLAHKTSSTRTTRSRSKEGLDRNELYRSSEICTVTYDSDESATVEMDDYFYIKASKLFVLTNRGPIKSFGLAESYTAQIVLQAIDIDGHWPPLLSGERPQGGQRWNDPFSVGLYCLFDSLPICPPTAQHELFVKTDSSSEERADLSLEVDSGWSDTATISRSQRGGLGRPLVRLPTPTSDRERYSFSGHTVLTIYFFLAPVDDKELQNYYGAPNTRNQHLFSVPGYTCPFCDGREFQNLTFLHLHLITAHDLFHFRVKQRKPTNGLRSNDAHWDSLVEVHVDLSKEQITGRASDHVPDHRTFRWQKPVKRFDVSTLLKGDWSWLNEKKSTTMAGNYRREPSQLNSTSIIIPKKINLNDVKPLPKRKRRKYTVPQARNGVTGLVFVRNRSKRFVHPNEELSESDDEVDEDWLKMKHEETVHDFTDVARNERSFMVLWDRHLFEERPTGYVHIPQVLVRFARAKAEFLRSSSLLVEFWKHCLNLVQYGIIDAECLKVCMGIVKGNEWSSAGKSELGIGLAGPIALDSRPSRPSSLVGANQMDVDEKDDHKKLTIRGSRKVEGRDSGFCTCGMPFDKPQMVLCVGLTCQRRWFHRSCFNLEKLLDGWICPTCAQLDVNRPQQPRRRHLGTGQGTVDVIEAPSRRAT